MLELQVSRVQKMLADEFGTASNIKSRVNRQSVLGAITSCQQRLKLYNRVGVTATSMQWELTAAQLRGPLRQNVLWPPFVLQRRHTTGIVMPVTADATG